LRGDIVNRLTVVAAVVPLVLGLSACAASPRQRPISKGPVDTGPGSLEDTRRQLQGTWRLSTFEVADAAGRLVPVRAKAELVYDAAGNLTVKGELLEPMPGQTAISDARALEYSGRAVIDTVRHELVLVGKAAVEPSPDIVAELGIDTRRRYEITPKQLTMSALDGSGRVISKATYTR
jgi:hypothetical protein